MPSILVFHKDTFKTRSNGYVTSLAILKGESKRRNTQEADAKELLLQSSLDWLPRCRKFRRPTEELCRKTKVWMRSMILQICIKIESLALLRNSISRPFQSMNRKMGMRFTTKFWSPGPRPLSFQSFACPQPLHIRTSLDFPTIFSNLWA